MACRITQGGHNQWSTRLFKLFGQRQQRSKTCWCLAVAESICFGIFRISGHLSRSVLCIGCAKLLCALLFYAVYSMCTDYRVTCFVSSVLRRTCTVKVHGPTIVGKNVIFVDCTAICSQCFNMSCPLLNYRWLWFVQGNQSNVKRHDHHLRFKGCFPGVPGLTSSFLHLLWKRASDDELHGFLTGCKVTWEPC